MEKKTGCLSWLCEVIPAAIARLIFKVPEKNQVETEVDDRLYQQILSRADSLSAIQGMTPQQLRDRLCNQPIFIDSKTKKVWIEKESKKPCLMISPRALSISWVNDNRYWNWLVDEASSFGEVVRLKAIYWLEVRGKVLWQELLRPNSKYMVLFRVKLANETGWEWSPVELSVTTSAGENRKCSRFLAGLNKPAQSPDGWMELDAGYFNIPEDPTGFEVEFSLTQLAPFWKQGLVIDSVKIIPSTSSQKS